MSHFERAWGREPPLRLVAPVAATPPVLAAAGERADHFAAYVRERLTAVPAQPARLDLDRLKVRLCDRLFKELAIAGATPERGALLELFAAALDEIKEREFEVEPPELVERVVVREPRAEPISPQQAIGLFYNEPG